MIVVDASDIFCPFAWGSLKGEEVLITADFFHQVLWQHHQEFRQVNIDPD